MLAKKLAQCLRPDLTAIHSLTLDVYADIFEREIAIIQEERASRGPEKYKYNSQLALFFSGLFNFYQFAKFEVKQKFLELFKEKLKSLKREIILSLPGFILCMLAALDENNGDIKGIVENILQHTE